MKWIFDLGLELYVANLEYPDSKQYAKSEEAMTFIRKHGLVDRLSIKSLARLNGDAEYFRDIITDPSKEIKLPFLVCGFGCTTSAFLGYSGLEEVTTTLTYLLLNNKNKG